MYKLFVLNRLFIPDVLIEIIKSYLFYDIATVLLRQTLRTCLRTSIRYIVDSPRFVNMLERSCRWGIMLTAKKVFHNENCLICGNFILDSVSTVLLLHRPKALSRRNVYCRCGLRAFENQWNRKLKMT